jgi:PAS domain S-box-containing protein
MSDELTNPTTCGVDLKETEKALSESQENFRALLNATTDMAFLMDTDGIVLASNENTARAYGTTLESLVGWCVYDFLPPQAAKHAREKAEEAANTRTPIRFQGSLKGRIFDNSIYQVFDETGKVKRVAVYSRDITEAIRVQDALRQAEEKYRRIYENATEGIFQVSPEGRIISANPSLAHIHGYDSPEDLINSVANISQIYVDPERRREMIRLIVENGFVRNFKAQMRRKDGSLQWVSMNARIVRDKEGRIAYLEGTNQDITERKRAEEALAESEERYRTAIENSNDGVAIIKDDAHIYVNRRFVEMFGYDRPEDILGKPIAVTVHPDDAAMVTDLNMQRRQRGLMVPRYEFRGVTRDGKVINIDVSAANIMYRGSPASLVYLRDITERKQAEEALKQSHLELERLSRAKSKAVNHISHELKTPLAVIQGNMRLIKRKLQGAGLDESLRSNFEVLERNLDRLFSISKETDEIFRVSQELEAGVLLGDLDRLWERVEDISEIPPDVSSHWAVVKTWMSQYMSHSALSFQSIDLYPYVQSLVEKARQKAPDRNIRYEVEGENDLYIFMDPDILGSVLEGLLRNAIENTPDEGLIRLTVEQKDEAVAVRITDFGVGIREENLQYLFGGLFDTQDTDYYMSKKPYEFGAGGKGFDLLRMKMYEKRFGFDISVESRRCVCIPTDQDMCPGDISRCTYCKTPDDCERYGSTTFTVSFPRNEKET